jgi:hypothetical protein
LSEDVKHLADVHVAASLNASQLQRCRVVWGDAREADWSEFDVVTMFLLPEGLSILQPAIAAAAGTGVNILSSGWPVPNLQHRDKKTTSGGGTIYLY